MRGLGLVVLVGCVDRPEIEPVASTEQATTVCARGDVVHGMDVSSYETSIDWQAAKAAGIDFAFIRVSDGLQYRDPKFATFWTGAAEAGVMRGAYQFFRPSQDPIAQADLLLDAIGPRQPGDLPPVIDVERNGDLPQAEVEGRVRTWLDHVEAAIGRHPIVYAGYYSWQDLTGNANLTAYPLWHAQYTSAPCPNIPTPWTRWTFWQHSSTATVDGVYGEPTDVNVFDGSLAELQAFADRAPASCGVIGAEGGEIDDGDACFSAGGPAATLRHATDAGRGGSLVWTRTTTSDYIGNFAQWTLDFAEAGRYRLEVFTPAAYAEATRATYKVRASGTTEKRVVDQTAGDGWQTIGELAFAAGDDQYVELDDNTGEPGAQLVFDAIRLTRLDRVNPMPDDPPPPPSPTDDADPDAATSSGCATGSDVGVAGALAGLGLLRRRRRSFAGR